MKEPILIDLYELTPGNPIAKISGCNADTRDYPEEIAEHNQAFAEWIEDDQNQSLCEATV